MTLNQFFEKCEFVDSISLDFQKLIHSPKNQLTKFQFETHNEGFILRN